jgi:hypothetical protein
MSTSAAVDLSNGHDFGDDRESGPIAHSRHGFESVVADPLEAVGGGPRFVNPAAQGLDTALKVSCDRFELGLGFHGAGSADD